MYISLPKKKGAGRTYPSSKLIFTTKTNGIHKENWFGR